MSIALGVDARYFLVLCSKLWSWHNSGGQEACTVWWCAEEVGAQGEGDGWRKRKEGQWDVTHVIN